MDEYLQSVRSLEQRLERASQSGQSHGIPRVELDPTQDRPAGIPADHAQHVRLMLDMIALAFQTDTTRVCTLMFGNAVSNVNFSFLDGVYSSHHELSHHQKNQEKLRQYQLINRWHVEQYAYLLQSAQVDTEGDATVLDNSLVLYGSGLRDGNSHNPHNLPILLAGRAGGRLTTGQHLCPFRRYAVGKFIPVDASSVRDSQDKFCRQYRLIGRDSDLTASLHSSQQDTWVAMSETEFLFACCQEGAESALKNEIARQWPDWRFAFSRPGFLTFKMADPLPPPERRQLKSVFSRTHGVSIGPFQGGDRAGAIEATRQAGIEHPFDHLHVWRRGGKLTGNAGLVPGDPEDALFAEMGEGILAEGMRNGLATTSTLINRGARVGQRVWDLILLDPDRWWLGWHSVTSFVHRWPGGVMPIPLPESFVSRAYLKTSEALAWSGWPVRPGDRCVEIGSAPGGSCQALLQRGLRVTGVDPSEMHPDVLRHRHFTHVQKRGADLRRRELRGFKWMLVDSNVAPQHTLDTVESLVRHPSTNFQGLLLTLKMPDWQLAGEVANYARRVRGWGFSTVRCRQLAYQRQEICLAALRHRALRRLPRRKDSRGKRDSAL